MPGRLKLFRIKHNESQFESVWPDRSQWSLLDPRTRRRDEEERIILMKSRDRRALDFIRIILSFSSSPDFSTKNVRICDKYVIIWCHGGDHSKWSIFFTVIYHPEQDTRNMFKHPPGVFNWDLPASSLMVANDSAAKKSNFTSMFKNSPGVKWVRKLSY